MKTEYGVLDLHLFFFFLNMKFYELHTVAGQEVGLNKLMNGFYCTRQINDYKRAMVNLINSLLC